MKNHGQMVCKNCGIDCIKRGPVQSYCEKCSEEADRKRKKTWAERNPLTKAQVAQIIENRKSFETDVLEAWNKKSASQARSMSWMEQEPDLAWVVRVRVPFLYRMSKNAIFSTNRFGHVALRREAKAIRHEITAVLRESLSRLSAEGVEIKENKLWIDLLVQKPNHRGDAINVIDLVCDAIKDGCGIDDRWFAIRRIDWEVVKHKPFVYIGIGQEEVEHGQICSACGAILPYESFNKSASSSNKRSITRVCRDCRRLQRQVQREQRELARGQQMLPIVVKTDQEQLL